MTAPVHVHLLGALTSIHLRRWALALHARGRRVTVATQHASEPPALPAGIEVHELPFSGGAGYVLNTFALRRLLGRLRPDLLHAHYASGYGTLAMLARYRPTLLSVWGSDVYDFPEHSPLHCWLLRRNLLAAQALASTSGAMARRVRDLVGADVDIAVTPFGVDVDRFCPRDAAAAEPPELTIGTIKTLAPDYGIDILVRAYARLRARRPELRSRLVVVGNGPQRQAIERLAAQLGLAGQVRFVGAVPHDQVPPWLHALDIYVAPSRRESFGVAVVEAMACGVPVIVSDVAGLPEVVEHGRSGVVVPAEDVGSLAGALERLADDPVLRRSLAAGGRARAVAAYAWGRCVDRMIECQDAAIAAGARR